MCFRCAENILNMIKMNVTFYKEETVELANSSVSQAGLFCFLLLIVLRTLKELGLEEFGGGF